MASDAVLERVEMAVPPGATLSKTPLPPQQRAERMTVEVDQLQFVEEVLVAREGAERLTNCAPAAVLCLPCG